MRKSISVSTSRPKPDCLGGLIEPKDYFDLVIGMQPVGVHV